MYSRDPVQTKNLEEVASEFSDHTATYFSQTGLHQFFFFFFFLILWLTFTASGNELQFMLSQLYYLLGLRQMADEHYHFIFRTAGVLWNKHPSPRDTGNLILPAVKLKYMQITNFSLDTEMIHWRTEGYEIERQMFSSLPSSCHFLCFCSILIIWID